MRNRTLDLRIPRSDALPLSHRDSMVSEVYYEVHIHIDTFYVPRSWQDEKHLSLLIQYSPPFQKLTIIKLNKRSEWRI